MSFSSPASSIPVFSATINQEFFIESQGGPQQPTSYLDRFPDTIYSTALDSTLVTLLYALLGPAGVGGLREAALEARLQLEEQNVTGADLDQLYSSPFGFARLAEETYTVDASADLLPSADRERILQYDASFRNRAIDYLKAIRAGGTKRGLALAAKSGLGHPVEVIENYRALFDQHADIPLGLPFVGKTTYLNEVIILPRKDIPRNNEQTLSFGAIDASYNGEPTQGWFTISVPLGPDYQTATVSTSNTSNIVTVPDSTLCSPGAYITIATPSYTYAQIDTILTPTTISVVHPPTSVSAGQPFNMTVTGTGTAYIGNAQTIPLPFNASASTLENALRALPVVGPNVQVSGGPLPNQPVTITFVGRLGDQSIPIILINVAPDNITGIGNPGVALPQVSQLADVTGNALDIIVNLTQSEGNIPATQEDYINQSDEYHMQQALDKLRPMTSFITTSSAVTTTAPIQTNTVFSGTQANAVISYETGNPTTSWPNGGWISPGEEHEKPHRPGSWKFHHHHYHRAQSVVAYTEEALSDPNYHYPQPDSTPVWHTYWDSHIGRFSASQRALFPFLAKFTDHKTVFGPMQALAPEPQSPKIVRRSKNFIIVDESYPSDYLTLPGTPQLPSKPGFWASRERAAHLVPLIDYLELDLGAVHAVNHVYFEITRKPCAVIIAHDTLDDPPNRQFFPVHKVPSYEAPTTDKVAYDTHTNPWQVVNVHFCNPRGRMVQTRFLRIGFQHEPGRSPFENVETGKETPYSIEVRNLRVGRNIAPQRPKRPRIQNRT